MSRTHADLLQAIREAKAKVIQAKDAMLEMSHRIDQPHLYVIAKSELAMEVCDLEIARSELRDFRYKAKLEREYQATGGKEIGDILELIRYADHLLSQSKFSS